MGNEKTQAEVVQEQELKYYFYEAMRCFDQEQYAEAMALFMHCEDICPTDAATAYYLSILYGGLGRKDVSSDYIAKAYRLSPESYWRPYSYKEFQSGDKRLALQAVQKEIKRHPDNVDAAETLQKMYTAMSNYKGALQAQDLIDKANGETVYSAIQRYQIYRQMGKNKQAVQALESYLKKEPDEPYLQVFLGDVYYALGDSARALERYQATEASNPSNPYLPLSMSTFYGEKGDSLRAADYLMRAIENEDASLEYKLNVLDQYHWLDAQEDGQQKALESLVRQYPQEETALVRLAKHYGANKRPQEAKALYEQAVLINADNVENWLELMMLNLQDSTIGFQQRDSIIRVTLGHLGEDDAVHRLVVNIFRGDIYTTEYLRDTTQRHLLDTAFACYDAVLRIDPENQDVLNNYAYFLAITGGDLRRAEKMSQKTIQKDPHNASFLDTYAWILHLEGQEMLARFYMQQAWNNAPDKEDKELLEHYQIIIKPNE